MVSEKHIKTPRGNIFYWVNDNEVTSDISLVFCHGLTADHTLFEMQVDAFKNTNRILLPDIPLHGKSIPYTDFSFQHVAADLMRIIEKENINNIVFVGQSAGGYIAQAFIDTYPDRVIGFVGVGTTPFGMQYYSKSELFWVKHFAAIAKLYPYGYYCKASSKSTSLTQPAQKNMYDVLVKLGKKNMLKAAKSVYTEFLKTDKSVRFPFPILLTYGESDSVGLVKKYNKQWAEAEGHTLVVIKNASHNANYDNHIDFNKLLNEYINRVGSK